MFAAIRRAWSRRRVGRNLQLRLIGRVARFANTASCLSQQEIFENGFAIAGGERPAASLAGDFSSAYRLGAGFGFDNIIERVAMWALEKLHH
jgi:hypothetical protein